MQKIVLSDNDIINAHYWCNPNKFSYFSCCHLANENNKFNEPHLIKYVGYSLICVNFEFEFDFTVY